MVGSMTGFFAAAPLLQEPGLWDVLVRAVQREPFHLVATILFFAAITHTFFVARFMAVSHRLRDRIRDLDAEELHGRGGPEIARKRDHLRLRMTVFHFLGEVEAVFGIWLIPLFVVMVTMRGADAMFGYIDSVYFGEPIFVVAIMAMASARPVVRFAEWILKNVASLGQGRVVAWWWVLLTVGPLLGSLITEPAAMTICAMLLGQRFFSAGPSTALRYATLGLLFVNVSVGGTLDHFAAPPIVMVAHEWDWGLGFMMTHFGWKALIGVGASVTVVWLVFRKELRALEVPTLYESETEVGAVPMWLTSAHLVFIAWVVYVSHHPALVVFSFLFYLAFVDATERHQDQVRLRGPLLVGFFLAALVIHGGLQAWWIQPLLARLGEWQIFAGAVGLTAFNDNAAITYLASLVPDLGEELRYAVVAGAVTGGGLTVIANAPNPAGQSILRPHFGSNGISPLGLFVAAIGPTLVMAAAFMLLP